MLAIIIIAILSLLILAVSCLTAARYIPVSNSQKLWLEKHFYIAILVWGASLVLALSFGSSSLAGSRLLSFILYLLFALCNALFLLYIRLFTANSVGYLLLLIPISGLFFINVLIFNKPTYNGAMDGFAALADMAIMKLILLSFPIFIFAFSMVKCRAWVKGAFMILFAAVTGFMGVRQSIGHEGYIADGKGGMFVFILLILAAIGFYYLLSDKRLRQIAGKRAAD